MQLRPDQKATVYGLCDPRTGDLRYIGCTIMYIGARLAGHLYEAKVGTPLGSEGYEHVQPKHKWLRDLIADGLEPEAFEIEQVEASKRVDAESFWIQYFHSIGCSLTNVRKVPGKKWQNGWRNHQHVTIRRYAENRRRKRMGLSWLTEQEFLATRPDLESLYVSQSQQIS